MKPSVRHDASGETRDAKIAWFLSLSFEERLEHIGDTLRFLTDCGARKPTWGEDHRDATESFRVVRHARRA